MYVDVYCEALLHYALQAQLCRTVFSRLPSGGNGPLGQVDPILRMSRSLWAQKGRDTLGSPDAKSSVDAQGPDRFQPRTLEAGSHAPILAMTESRMSACWLARRHTEEFT